MPVSRAKIFVLFGIVLNMAMPAYAQMADDNGRDASFLPLTQAPVGTAAPNTAPQAPAALATPPSPNYLPPPSSSSSVQIFNGPTAPTPLVNAPLPALSRSPPAAPPPGAPITSAPLAPLASAPPTADSLITAPPSTASAAVSPVAPAMAPVAPSPALPLSQETGAAPSKATEKTIESNPINSIDPESVGLLGPAEGGLGAAMWKGTPRSLVERLLPSVTLPLLSPTLNRLAARFLLTTASVPEGEISSAESLTSMRIEKLLMLGDSQNAWKLAQLTKPEQLDEITLRLVAEAALLSSERDNVCAKLPDIIKTHAGVEWQKLLLICQLRSGDTKAAQLTLDLLHAQNIKDDVYFSIVEKNVIAGFKQLPRQLTPLKPLTLALLRLTNLPLPGEIYVHPEATLIPELLAATPREDTAQLGLAERAAERGLLSATDLEGFYRKASFPAEVLATATNSSESGPRLHALLFQAALLGKTPEDHLTNAFKFMQVSTPTFLNGAGGQVLADMIAGITPATQFNTSSATIAHIYVVAGKPEVALEWMKLAKHASVGLPSVAAELLNLWPMSVYAGLESDADYNQDLQKWLDMLLKQTDPKGDNHIQKDQAASILLLLDVTGFAVSEEAWSKVADVPVFERHVMPPALLLERLRAASTTNHRGETVMLSFLLAAGNANDISLLATVEVVRALRLVGLTSDAASLARETAGLILAPPQAKP